MSRLGLHRSVVPLVPLLAWTLFVWSSRIRNVWTDEDLTTDVIRNGALDRIMRLLNAQSSLDDMLAAPP